jgi:hypothetical protein
MKTPTLIVEQRAKAHRNLGPNGQIQSVFMERRIVSVDTGTTIDLQNVKGVSLNGVWLVPAPAPVAEALAREWEEIG